MHSMNSSVFSTYTEPTRSGPASSSAVSSSPSSSRAAAADQTQQPSQPGTATPVRGRFAPTPSGRMHLGNIWCALTAWLAVRSAGGTLVMRIEDLDLRKMPAGAEEALLGDLHWLGLDWDQGPYRQSERTHLYQAAADKLQAMGLTYPCFCSRADLHAASAPHASDGTPIYPGTCRNLPASRLAELMDSPHQGTGRKPALRLQVPAEVDPAGTISFTDRVYGPQTECLARQCGDFVIRRSDGIYAYQLAVTVDDADMGINQVVRGRDLLGSSARQIYLMRLLGYPQPSYAHLPMLLAHSGQRRLSKRDHDTDMGFMRAHFRSPEQLLGRLAHLMGLTQSPAPEALSAQELIPLFSWDALKQPADKPVPGSFFMDV